jgi:hypothetical protein
MPTKRLAGVQWTLFRCGGREPSEPHVAGPACLSRPPAFFKRRMESQPSLLRGRAGARDRACGRRGGSLSDDAPLAL